MEGKCIVSSCGKARSKFCGSCGLVRYYSIETQRDDWNEHHKKLECGSMKKLSSASFTEKEINDVADRIMDFSDRLSADGKDEKSIYQLDGCIVFVRDSLRRLDSNDPCSMTGDGVKLNNIPLCRLLVKLGHTYYNMPSSSETDNHAINYLSEARELLVQRKDKGKDDMVMWELLIGCDKYLGPLYAKIGQLEKAKYQDIYHTLLTVHT